MSSGLILVRFHATLSQVGEDGGMSVVSLVLALQLAGCSGLALWSCVRAESWPSGLVMGLMAAVMLVMMAGAVASV